MVVVVIATTQYHALPLTITYEHPLPLTTTRYHSLPLTTTHLHSLPLTTTRYHALPLTTTHYHLLPLTTTHYHSPPLTTTQYHSLPLTTTHYHSILLTITYHHYHMEEGLSIILAATNRNVHFCHLANTVELLETEVMIFDASKCQWGDKLDAQAPPLYASHLFASYHANTLLEERQTRFTLLCPSSAEEGPNGGP